MRYTPVVKKPIFDEQFQLFQKHGITKTPLELAFYKGDVDGYGYNFDFVEMTNTMSIRPQIEGDVIDVIEYQYSRQEPLEKFQVEFTTLVCDIEQNKDIILQLFALINNYYKKQIKMTIFHWLL